MEPVKPKILLCEDDANLGMVLKNYLELNDYDVTLERDGRLGLAAFQREKLDRKSTRLNSSHLRLSRMPSSA